MSKERRKSFHKDSSTGNYFEHDHETGESRWMDKEEVECLPEGSVQDDDFDGADDADTAVSETEMVNMEKNPLAKKKERRQSYKDATSGNHYEHDHETGQTRWLATITVPAPPASVAPGDSYVIPFANPDKTTGEFIVPPHLEPGTVVLVDSDGELFSVVSAPAKTNETKTSAGVVPFAATAPVVGGAAAAGAMYNPAMGAPPTMEMSRRAGPEVPLYLAIDSLVVEGVQYYEKPAAKDGMHVQYYKNDTEYIDYQKRRRYCCNCCCCKRPAGMQVSTHLNADLGKMAPANESCCRDFFGKQAEFCSCHRFFLCCFKPKHMRDPSMPGANAGTLGAVKGFFGVSETYDAKYAVSTVLKNPSGTVLYEIRERDAGHWYIGDLCTCAFWCGFCPCCCGKKQSTGVTGQTTKKQSCFCYLLTCGPCKAWTRYCLRLRYCIPCIQFCTPCLLGCNAVTLPCKRSETTAWCDFCAAPWNCLCPCCQICCGVGCECCHITVWGLKDIPYVIESQPIFKPNVAKPVGSLDSIWFQDRVLSASINVPGAVSKNDRILLSSLAYELMANDGGLVRDNAFGPIQYFLIQKKVGYKEYFDTVAGNATPPSLFGEKIAKAPNFLQMNRRNVVETKTAFPSLDDDN